MKAIVKSTLLSLELSALGEARHAVRTHTAPGMVHTGGK